MHQRTARWRTSACALSAAQLLSVVFLVWLPRGARSTPSKDSSGFNYTSDQGNLLRLDGRLRELGKHAAAGEWGAATVVYEAGDPSLASLGVPPSSSKEAYLLIYARHFGNNTNFVDTTVRAALTGSGAYATRDTAFRAAAAVAGVQYLTLWMAVLHRVDAAAAHCREAKAAAKGASAEHVAASLKQIDAAWALYTGSATRVDRGAADATMLHSRARALCPRFRSREGVPACSAVGPGKVSDAVLNLLFREELTNAGSRARARLCNDLADGQRRVAARLAALALQEVLAAAFDLRGAAGMPERARNATHGRAWMAANALLPLVALAEQDVAKTLEQSFDPARGRAMRGRASALTRAMFSVYSRLGVACADVGELSASGFPAAQCKDDGVPQMDIGNGDGTFTNPDPEGGSPTDLPPRGIVGVVLGGLAVALVLAVLACAFWRVVRLRKLGERFEAVRDVDPAEDWEPIEDFR